MSYPRAGLRQGCYGFRRRGPELSPAVHASGRSASAMDGSIGDRGEWGGMSRVAGYLPESTAREWFTDP